MAVAEMLLPFFSVYLQKLYIASMRHARLEGRKTEQGWISPDNNFRSFMIIAGFKIQSIEELILKFRDNHKNNGYCATDIFLTGMLPAY